MKYPLSLSVLTPYRFTPYRFTQLRFTPYRFAQLRVVFEMSFSNLPPDIIRYLTSFSENTPQDISLCKKICSNWKKALSDTSIEEDGGLESVFCVTSSKFTGPRTRTLMICWNVQDETLIEIAMKCQNLEYLDISYCYLITSFSLNRVLKTNSNLKFVNVIGCPKLTL